MDVVADMKLLGWGESGEAMGVGGEQLRECSDLLNSVSLRDDVIDRWIAFFKKLHRQ